MFKILYATSNNQNSPIILDRFLKEISKLPIQIKIAAYKNFYPKNINVDWTLDCLLNYFKPNHISLDNDNYKTYYDQVKYYNPDLIISDLEYFTSHIANVLNIDLWQCSSSLIYLGLNIQQKYNLGVFKQYSYLISNDRPKNQRNYNCIDNSSHNFIYSHFGDMNTPPPIKDKFEWVRPYHQIGKISIPCKHNIVAAINNTDKEIIKNLKQYKDVVLFSYFIDENHLNIELKNINNETEYFCNLRNCSLFINEGQTSFLADAFYNGKQSIVFPNLKDPECIVNSIISEKLLLSKSYDKLQNLEETIPEEVVTCNNTSIKYLHEKIIELL